MKPFGTEIAEAMRPVTAGPQTNLGARIREGALSKARDRVRLLVQRELSHERSAAEDQKLLGEVQRVSDSFPQISQQLQPLLDHLDNGAK